MFNIVMGEWGTAATTELDLEMSDYYSYTGIHKRNKQKKETIKLVHTQDLKVRASHGARTYKSPQLSHLPKVRSILSQRERRILPTSGNG